jgi:membrane-associated phospholipid phosphatase
VRATVGCLSLSVAIASTSRASWAQELRYDLALDVPITIGGGAALAVSEILKADLAPSSCRWCDRAGDGSDTLNGLDRGVRDGLRWENPGAAATASNVIGLAMMPLAMGTNAIAAAHDERASSIGIDLLVVTEAGVLAAGLNQVVKFMAGRERPFVHVLTPDQKKLTEQPSDNNLSFFSGHTCVTMAIAVAAGTTASLRKYSWAPVVWGTGVTLSLTTGYLRIGADKHYFTDVMTGALAGALVGFVVPYVFHRPQDSPAGSAASAAQLRGTEGPTVVGFSGVW